MKIKTRLRLNTGISLVVVMLIMLSLAWSFWEIDRADRNENLVEELRKVAFERISLRDDYLLHQEKLASNQWVAKSETLRGLMETASERFTAETDKVLLQKARKEFDATFSAFSTILEKHKREGRNAKNVFAPDEAESRLIAQVFLKASSLMDSIGRLYESTERAATRARTRGFALIVFIIIGGTIATVVNSTTLNRIVAKRLMILNEGVGIIGGGNLNHRINTGGDDELSALARASNEMAARLKETYTSVENLQREITAHTQAKEEIQRLNAELEQRVLDRTAQLETANRELEAFSYSVSHDLRGPLRAIDGFSNILLEDYEGTLDAEGKRLLNVIRTNTQHMDQLITDLLALSRVSKSQLKLSRVDMTAMAHSVYNEIASTEVQQKFVFTVAPLPNGTGDPVLLRQAWYNLLSNAIKYTTPRDERRIEITGHTEEGTGIYSIRDTGVGFNPKYIHKLFGVFQRLHKSTEFEGNGVGLAIVQRIIHRHGGHAWAEGKVNEGATFSFSLPCKEEYHE